MNRISKFDLRCFLKREDGNATIEFVIMVPLIFTIFMTAVELGIYSMRQMWLDRGLDLAMREVRLNTSNIPSHDDMKLSICENSNFIPDCLNSVKIEMEAVNPRAFAALDGTLDCVDRSLPTASQQDPNYTTGEEHDLMLVRACVKFDPIFPSTGLGFYFAQNGDNAGQSFMTASSAFVQEPGDGTTSTGTIFEAGSGEEDGA